MKWFERINRFLDKKLSTSGLIVIPFSIFFAIAFPIFFFVYIKTEKLWLDSLCTIVSILPLLAYREIGISKKYLPIYWTVFLIITLPFNFTYNLIINPYPIYAMGEIIMIMTLTMVISDLVFLFFILFAGIALGCLLAPASLTQILHQLNLSLTGPVYGLALFLGVIVMLRRHNVERNAEDLKREQALIKERNKTMRVLTASIAHELRTPFASAEGIAQTLQQSMPKLLQEDSAPSDKNNQKLSKAMLDYLRKKDLGNSLSGVVKRAHTFVNMMQQKINYGDLSDPENQEVFSVLPQIQEALDNYAMEPEEAERVILIKDHDFNAKGTPLLLQHVILNLLKNALHYTHSKDNAKIEIWLEQSDQTNQIHFKDTGQGINSEDLPRIFEAFFSKTVHGTGVGLAFCKMVVERNFKGNISCDSELGRYTHFVIELRNVDGVLL